MIVRKPRRAGAAVERRGASPAPRCAGSGDGQLDLARRRPASARAGCPRGRSSVSDRHDDLLADRVDRRVGDLREELLEVVVEQLRPVREHRERRVVAHRADRPRRRRRPSASTSILQVLGGVAERLLAPQHGLVVGLDDRRRARAGPRARPALSLQPLAVRLRARRSRSLISSSAMIRPCSVSTRNMRPGCSRPFSHDVARRGMSSTPTSDAMTTRSSLVT